MTWQERSQDNYHETAQMKAQIGWARRSIRGSARFVVKLRLESLLVAIGVILLPRVNKQLELQFTSGRKLRAVADLKDTLHERRSQATLPILRKLRCAEHPVLILVKL